MEIMKHKSDENVGETERWVSMITGVALLLYGLRLWSRGSLPTALLGGSLIYRGATGYCPMYEALGVSTSGRGKPYGRGVKVKRAMMINKPAEELYRFWRDFENLPRFMNYLESVRVIDDKRSHWVAKAPAGTTVEWDAEITVDRENEMIGWRSIEGSEVDNAGYVRFDRAPGKGGTVVRVSLQYNPPAGKVGATVAKLFREEPEQQIKEDLYRFKQLMETGEIATT
ncbi:MAG TPA: SRPBCC family protein [Thermodesulfobacteriota bacterium]|nr:SRPBCC family protein [Thermodesulfobacteriota bacterium]